MPRSCSVKPYVLGHRHMRIERVVLEHHGDVPLERRQIVDPPPTDQDVAGARILQPGDEIERRRLAAAGRPEQGHELPVADLQVDAPADGDRAETLGDGAQFDLGHGALNPSPCPRRNPA